MYTIEIAICTLDYDTYQVMDEPSISLNYYRSSNLYLETIQYKQESTYISVWVTHGTKLTLRFIWFNLCPIWGILLWLSLQYEIV